MKENKKNTLSTTRMILGIISLCLSFIPLINFFSKILGILAIIFSIIPLIQKKVVSSSVVGLILGVLSLIITFSLDFNFTGQNKNIKASITDNKGNTSQMTAKEVIDLKNNNAAIYNEEYYKSQVNVTSTVKKIEGPYQFLDHEEYYTAYLIVLDGNWQVRVSENNEVIKKLKIGDKVKVTNVTIAQAFGRNVDLVGAEMTKVKEDGMLINQFLHYPEKTKLEIVK